jgi:sulfur-carrier protein adenylyltransferase/sulfurtransferase
MTQQSTTRRGKTFQDLVTEAKEHIQEVTPEELRTWQHQGKDIVILDVREPEDYSRGQIPGAVNIPRGMLELEIDELVPDQDKVVVAYCGGGSRSALAAETLQVMGYTNAYSLAKGFRGWNQ